MEDCKTDMQKNHEEKLNRLVVSMSAIERALMGDINNPKEAGILEEHREMMAYIRGQKRRNNFFFREFASGMVAAGITFALVKLGMKQ